MFSETYTDAQSRARVGLFENYGLGFTCLGYRVHGLGLWVSIAEFAVYCFGFRGEDLGFGV
jgi:hypothetical protein